MEKPSHVLTQNSSTTIFDDIPKEICWGNKELVQWEGFWYPQPYLAAAMAARSHFQERQGDVFLASSMKTGTTWLKAVIPCIMNYKATSEAFDDYDPFITSHPNELMPSLEVQLYLQDPNADLSGMPSPRLFRTHMPYSMLPDCIKKSACKIVYITRNPKDVSVSLWHFMNSKEKVATPLNEVFDSFCKGIHPFGPFHDHVLGYWKESLKRPDKILFLKYEELKRDPRGQVQKLASFLGNPMFKEEDLDNLLWKCSLERLKNLEVNKNGIDPYVGFAYKAYFRIGVVGDSNNYLSEEMKERLDKITQMKLQRSGLDL